MPLTVNVGYSQKLGRPDFGSVGASCHVECELDGQLAFDDPEQFQSRIRELYTACAQAVERQLSQHQSGNRDHSTTPRNGTSKASREARTAGPAESKSATNGSANHRASSRQIEYLNQLARQLDGLGVRGLESLAQRICGKPLANLSSFDASSLIDTLKAIKSGKLDVEGALQGAAS
jgi:hypothetical protein